MKPLKFTGIFMQTKFRLLATVVFMLTGPSINAQNLVINQIQPNTGAIGSSFTIYGSGFDGTPADNSVIFTPVGGGVGTTATVTGGSATFLTVTVPENIDGGNYTLSIERSSDGATTTAVRLFGVATAGGFYLESGSTDHIVSDSAGSAQSIHAADVDADGDLDLISASAFDDKIAWYENNGGINPSFTEMVVSDTADAAQSVYAGDVDGDGDLDLMSASADDNKIAWYENEGGINPSFTEWIVSDTASTTQSVHAGDVDGDGDLDLMSASADDNKIAWYENDGAASPTFLEHMVQTNGDGVQSVYAGDVDGDGDLDLMSASLFDVPLQWYENDGSADPSFTARNINNGSSRSVYAGDIDADGDLDVLATDNQSIVWHENNGAANPVFTRRVINGIDATSSGIHAGDMDGDGDLDLMASYLTDTIALYENNGDADPVFTERVISTNVNAATSVYTADVEGDGDLDVVSAANNTNTIIWHENIAIPTVTQLQPLNGAPGNSLTIYGTDFDATPANNTVSFTSAGGGAATAGTVTAAGSTNLTVTIPAGLAGGNYVVSVNGASSPELFSVATGGGYHGASGSFERVVSTSAHFARSVSSGDVDGDGDLDLMSASESDNTIAWYENNGAADPTFVEQVTSDTTNGARSVHTGDVDGDGDLDLMSASANDDKIAWYENDGGVDPAFTEHIVSTEADTATSVYAGDVDGDGDLDLMSASNSKIAWYENDGASDPTFIEQGVNSAVDAAQSVFAVDLDDDGDLDLMSASNSKIAWYENSGADNPSFTERIVGTPGAFVNSVHAADIDKDGDIDLMSAYSNVLAWYENDGAADPTFTEQIVSTNASIYYDVQAGDLDGDSDLDLMSASYFNYSVAWFENDGGINPTFTQRIITSSNTERGYSIYSADVDNDGDLDLMTADLAGNKIAWYENISPPSFSGRSITMDGTDDYLTVDDNNALDLTNGFTIEAWVRPQSLDSLERIAGKNGAYGVGFSSTDLLLTTFTIKDYYLPYGLLIEDQWVHLAFVLNENNDAIFYVDGDSVGIIPGDNPANIAVDPLTIGNFIGTQHVHGQMDEVRIWKEVRTRQQIRRNMFQQLNGDETNLAGYWPMDEVEGTTTEDLTANENNATLVNGPIWSTDTHPYGTFITGDEGWRMMTSPVGGASFNDLLDDLWTQGFTGADVTGGTSNVLTWDESAGDWTTISDATDVPAAGTGFIVYVYADEDPDAVGTQGGFPKTIRVENTQNDGTIAPTLTFTSAGVPEDDGWNLVGNPYGATIDWDAASGWTKTNLDASFYVWSDSASGGAGAYLSWSSGGSGTLPNSLIAPWQGFWVQANAASPALQMTDEVRSAGGVLYKRQSVPQIKFKLAHHIPTGSGDGELEGTDMSSRAVLMFNGQAVPGKDRLDAWKLQSLNRDRYLSLYTTTPEGHALDINALPVEIEQPLELTMNFEGSDLGGRYTLSWNPQHLPASLTGGSVRLTDLHTGRIIALDQAGEYSFQVQPAKSKGAGVRQRHSHGTTPSNKKSLSRLAQASTLEPYSPKRGRFGQPRFGPIPTALRAKAKNPRFLLTINPGSGRHQLAGIPRQVELAQNYPNPFNPATVIRYGVPEQARVQLTVYDVLGRRVATLINEQRTPGRYQVSFNASRFASGLYIYRLKVGGNVLTRKMMLIK